MKKRKINKIKKEIEWLQLQKECNQNEICSGCGACYKIAQLEKQLSNL